MGTHRSDKGQASSHTNNSGKKFVKCNMHGHKINMWVREKTKVIDVVEEVTRQKMWVMSVEYKVTDGHDVHPVSPSGT